MTIDRHALTATLAAEVKILVDDLRRRADEPGLIQDRVVAEWQAAADAGRTAHDVGTWREGLLAQVAVSWVLGLVFVRFCEDNGLVTEALVSGRDNDHRRWAGDNERQFYRDHPSEGQPAYVLRAVFAPLSRYAGLREVFGPHNPVWLFPGPEGTGPAGPSEDAIRDLLTLFRTIDEESGNLRWDFHDPDWDTRFLGDLYQDLSEHARKTYALLQTPDFVEEFILDRTLDPALAEFGLDGHDGTGFRMIDPACGSGHFLLGAFDRLARAWLERDPGAGPRTAAARALRGVYGVDLNPFAVAIARFRLLLAALRFAGITRLTEEVAWEVQVAAGDSLLHGPPPGRLQGTFEASARPAARHLYRTEDAELLQSYLGQHYHAVVANPPYITPKDPAANAEYRERYTTCHRSYSLAVPFMERLFDLALRGTPSRPAGFVGQITANSFMKREFGSKLIEQFLAKEVDLTHVIDTSGAYIPGHGTPTVILLGRNRLPIGDRVRAVLGIRGEPSAPAEPAKGLVWRSIVELIDSPGTSNDYVSVDDVGRSVLAIHPWSLQGGFAAPLKERVEGGCASLAVYVESPIGRAVRAGADEVFMVNEVRCRHSGLEANQFRALLIGENLRDWVGRSPDYMWYPYGDLSSLDPEQRILWPWKALLANRATFQGVMADAGLRWFDYMQHTSSAYRTPLSIAFAFVATHNHFVLDRGGKVFNRSAPVIKLPAGASEEEHLQLLGLLNSAVACFWMKQVIHRKSQAGGGGGSIDAEFTHQHEFDGTKLKQFPVANGSVLAWAKALDDRAQELGRCLPGPLFEGEVPSTELLAGSERRVAELRAEMVWLQEELDWRCAHLYGVIDRDLSFPPEQVFALAKGERAFEVALARRVADGSTTTEWFRRHGSTPVTELPAQWPAWYRERVEQRLALIEGDRFVNLLERPEYKRRWNWEAWGDLAREALKTWLLTRLEDARYWPRPEPRSVAQLADAARADAELMQVAALYQPGAEVDLVSLITELVAEDAVPFLAAWRYTESGRRKRAAWERTWDLQRQEDAGHDIGKIAVPPKYGSTDFSSTTIWKLRGKLDVPKERFLSYPGLERAADPTPVVGWAGWDHLAQAQALVELYRHRRTQEGWSDEEVVPILAGLAELLPWLRQWHNTVDPSLGQGLGDYFTDYVTGEAQMAGTSLDALAAWTPPAKPKRGRPAGTSRGRGKTKAAAASEGEAPAEAADNSGDAMAPFGGDR